MIDIEARRRAEFARLTASFNARQMAQIVVLLRTINEGGDPSALITAMLGEDAAAPFIAEFNAIRARRA